MELYTEEEIKDLRKRMSKYESRTGYQCNRCGMEAEEDDIQCGLCGSYDIVKTEERNNRWVREK